MKEKERLLSLGEPLRFLFSHSALREGWDNPNVFQICTLNESQSATKKRQEIGRGLTGTGNEDYNQWGKTYSLEERMRRLRERVARMQSLGDTQ